MKLVIYSDCHYYTPQEIRCIPTDLDQINRENSFSIGDNFDRKGAEPSMRIALEREFKTHRALFTGRFITGNHDVMCDDVTKQYLIVSGHIMLVHGDWPSWGVEKSNTFRNEQAYQGWSSVKGMLAGLRKLWGGHMSKSEARDAANIAKMHKCNVIIFGHTHVKEVQDRTIDGIRVLNAPRGRSEVEV